MQTGAVWIHAAELCFIRFGSVNIVESLIDNFLNSRICVISGHVDFIDSFIFTC